MRSGGSDSDVAEDWGLVWCDAVWFAELFSTFQNALLPPSSRASSPFFFDWMNLEGMAQRHIANVCPLQLNDKPGWIRVYVVKDTLTEVLTWRTCKVTAQSIQRMFRNGAVGMRFRYCDWRFSLRNVPNVSLFPPPPRRITHPLLVHRSVTLFSCRLFRTAVLSNVFLLLYILNSI
jgi:hypothetical protein